MSGLTPSPGEDELLAFETYGVSVAVNASDPALLSRARELLPPHSRACDLDSVTHRFSLTTADDRRFSLQYALRDGVPAQPIDPNSWIATAVDLDFALGLLDSYWRSCIALHAPEHIFVQAGVVAHQGRLIVMPGKVLSGKTTLVVALVRQGATYYSDDFAVLDREGRVHPYAARIPLSEGNRVEAPNWTGNVGEEPLPIGALVASSYFPGAEWRPRRLSSGEGALALLSHAEPAQARPEETLSVIKGVLEHEPVMIESLRDEADIVASLLLADLGREPAGRV